MGGTPMQTRSAAPTHRRTDAGIDVCMPLPGLRAMQTCG